MIAAQGYPAQSKTVKDRHQRLGGHIQYNLSDCFLSYVTVSNQRLYFQKYDEQVTISVLNEQYAELNEGKQLKFQTQTLKIDPTMPLAQITSTLEKIQVLQRVLQNFIEQKDPIQQIQKPELKKIAQDIVFTVKKHNQKLQTDKDFQSHQCQIELKERPQCNPTLQYFVTQTTTINEIAQEINKLAGNQVYLALVQTSNKIIYSRNQFGKPFSQLRMNSKQLIFSYSPVLTFNKIQKFTVKLTNSSYLRQIVQIKVKKQDSILIILKTIKEITKNQNDPLEIKDSEGNIISQDRWNAPVQSFIFRNFMFQFVYPTFLSYDCKINVVNHPGKPVSITYPIQKDTTFNHIINHIRQEIRCVNAYFKIYDSAGKIYGPEYRNKSLFRMQIQETFFKFEFIKPRCLISGQTKIVIQGQQQGLYDQISVKQLTQLDKIQDVKVLSYNQETHQMQLGKISCFRKQTGYSRLFQVSLAGDQQLIHLQCFSESIFMTQKFEWKPAQMLVKGERVMILSIDFQNIYYAQVVDLKQIGIDVQEQVFTLEVLPHHNFIANRVIIHNDDSITISAHFFSTKESVRKQKINCYIHDKLEKIEAFRGKKLTMGGLALKNNYTFGDYQIDNFGTIFVFDEDYKTSSKDFIISEWREQSYQHDQVNVMLKNKWTTDCLGLRQSKIIELKEGQLNLKNHNRPEHLLVSPKIHLQKLHYIYNIAPQHSQYEQSILRNVFRAQLLNNQSYRVKFQELTANSSGILTKQLQILPVYLYTTNLVYRTLNQFLRQSNKSSWTPEQYKKWYVLANSLMNSLDKLPTLQYKTLYRGLSNISIKDAFSRRQNKDKQSYLILNSFTSTTTEKDVALGFISGRGALLTIKTTSGKSIKNYSQYNEEDEVLLPPFLYFRITKFQPDLEIQQIELEEIPFPKTRKNKLIFWVDDTPVNNKRIIEDQFESKDIEVVQVLSTSVMKIILRDFFGVLQAMGKQIVIISDMSRYEDGAWNSEAGVDLFNLIYKEYGMSNKAIIYTMDQNRALQAIQQRGINPGKWSVLVDPQLVIDEVMAQFKR